jgi:hypothetical protein
VYELGRYLFVYPTIFKLCIETEVNAIHAHALVSAGLRQDWGQTRSENKLRSRGDKQSRVVISVFEKLFAANEATKEQNTDNKPAGREWPATSQLLDQGFSCPCVSFVFCLSDLLGIVRAWFLRSSSTLIGPHWLVRVHQKCST